MIIKEYIGIRTCTLLYVSDDMYFQYIITMYAIYDLSLFLFNANNTMNNHHNLLSPTVFLKLTLQVNTFVGYQILLFCH